MIIFPHALMDQSPINSSNPVPMLWIVKKLAIIFKILIFEKKRPKPLLLPFNKVSLVWWKPIPFFGTFTIPFPILPLSLVSYTVRANVVLMPLTFSVTNSFMKSSIILFFVRQNMDTFAMEDSFLISTYIRFTGVSIDILALSMIVTFYKLAIIHFSSSCKIASTIVNAVQKLARVDRSVFKFFYPLAVRLVS